jgi:hypothetical protein
MMSLFEEVRDSIQLDTYTIDFAVCPQTMRTQIVEINNPPPKAGTSLFIWDDEKDRSIIENGPFEFRLLEKPDMTILDTIYTPIQTLMTEIRESASSPSYPKD